MLKFNYKLILKLLNTCMRNDKTIYIYIYIATQKCLHIFVYIYILKSSENLLCQYICYLFPSENST